LRHGGTLLGLEVCNIISYVMHLEGNNLIHVKNWNRNERPKDEGEGQLKKEKRKKKRAMKTRHAPSFDRGI
jgi:hypothetical protein